MSREYLPAKSLEAMSFSKVDGHPETNIEMDAGTGVLVEIYGSKREIIEALTKALNQAYHLPDDERVEYDG